MHGVGGGHSQRPYSAHVHEVRPPQFTLWMARSQQVKARGSLHVESDHEESFTVCESQEAKEGNAVPVTASTESTMVNLRKTRGYVRGGGRRSIRLFQRRTWATWFASMGAAYRFVFEREAVAGAITWTSATDCSKKLCLAVQCTPLYTVRSQSLRSSEQPSSL